MPYRLTLLLSVSLSLLLLGCGGQAKKKPPQDPQYKDGTSLCICR